MRDEFDESRHAMHQIIANVAEGIIMIDRAGDIQWANEAALRLHGVGSLDKLGGNAMGYRQRFHMRYITGQRVLKSGAPIEMALAGKSVDPVTLWVGAAGESEPLGVHKVHSVSLTDAAGQVTGHVLVHSDITRQFQAEERFERTFAANPAPSLICRLSDQRFIKVNDGFLAMARFKRDGIVGRSLKETGLFFDAQWRSIAQGNLDQCECIGPSETVIRTGEGAFKHVLVAGQPLEVGDETCMLFTFVDRDPQREVEASLRTSEELFSKAFHLAPMPMLVMDREANQLVDVNDAFLSVMRLRAEQWRGQSLHGLGLWQHASALKTLNDALSRGETVHNMDATITAGDGDTLQCVVWAAQVRINQKECALIVMQDATARKRNETELISAIDAVMRDTSWFSRSVIEKLAHLRRPDSPGGSNAALADLTARERDVLGAICQGMSDAEIAESLGIAKNTVRNHIATLYEKIRVNRRSAAVVWARERGFTGEKKS